MQVEKDNTAKYNPFRIHDLILSGFPQGFKKPLVSTLEWLLSLHRLAKGYEQLPETRSAEEFADTVLDYLNIDTQTVSGNLEDIPATGPVLVVANHPFGGIEGVIFTSLLKKVRPDIKIMANGMLKRIPELEDIFIGVNPYGHAQATKQNTKPLREAITWLKEGGLLAVFPAGDVSRFKLRDFAISDGDWDERISRIVKLTKPRVVPIYFSGRNSALFHCLGLAHPLMRTLMLPRELANKRNRRIELKIGEVIKPKRLQSIGNSKDLAHYLRLHTYMLERMQNKPEESERLDSSDSKQQSIIEPVNSALLAAEIAALPSEQLLEKTGNLHVYHAKSDQIPWLLQEIGRLREMTFRAVGEGTGKPLDIDLFDSYYQHLFIWNAESKEVVGGYRLGLADEIMDKYGKKGLYSHSLFKYSRRLLKSLNPAIEMGRSFVRPEYQRSFTPLLLLWKGIGQFVVRRSHYAVLFGPVSISNDYNSVSQKLLVDFLKINNYDDTLSRHIRPRQPYRGILRPVWRRADLAGMQSIDDVSELVAVLENGNRGVPILIKQYLKLGGRLLGFNVDREFGNCIDGLIMVDLRHTDPRVLQKYMGLEGAAHYLESHKTGLEQIQ